MLATPAHPGEKNNVDVKQTTTGNADERGKERR
jgi:hypothetical protein